MTTIDTLNTLYTLAKNITDSQYQQQELSVGNLITHIFQAALQGQYYIVFKYPDAIANALVIEAKGDTPDFSAEVLSKFKADVDKVITAFKDSIFIIEGIPDVAGFKISWRKTPTTASTTEPTAININNALDGVDNIDEDST